MTFFRENFEKAIFFIELKVFFKGGMKRHNKGRKTPGGVFIALLRQNPDVDQNELEKIIDNHSQFGG